MALRRAVIISVVLIIVLASSVTLVQAQEQTHVVQAGETLYRIAAQYGLTVEQLAAANGITNPALIYVGQVLVIPNGDGESTASGTTSYTVAAGDTLYSIARRFDTTVATLVSLNGLSNANVLYIGQVLVLPGGESTTTTVTPEPTEEEETETPEATEEPTSDEPVYHTVQRGQTLSQIALLYGMTYQEIALLNGLDNPNLIFPGQELLIKSGEEEEEDATDTPTPTSTATSTVTPTATATSTGEPTATPTATATEEESGEATATPTATSIPTMSVTPSTTPTDLPEGIETPTPIVQDVEIPSDAPNLLDNPGFEGSVRSVDFDSVQVFDGWQPFYCAQPYTSEKCAALRQGAGNPEGLLMSRPVYKSTNTTYHVHGGTTAQQWSCSYSACRGGVYQIIETVPGASCEVGAYVQSLSTNSSGITSDLLTADDRDNSTWYIRVDLSGGESAFTTGDNLLISRGFGYIDGTYDRFAKIGFTFTATDDETAVYFENLRLWPLARNRSYLDDAYVRCSASP
ncbi:MAG: LysM peptidoglycan-binding domain-containing protein [Anaerolineae bacterium]|nr:LysM peptidoglycan-binding domain-containing protein [Anaerolineae bacterium]